MKKEELSLTLTHHLCPPHFELPSMIDKQTIELAPIAIIRTPYKQKFAIPRQPGLVKSAFGKIEFLNDYNDPNSLRGIEQFSHLWLIFQFHQTVQQGWSPLVRPPRLGGNAKQGVFATRSTFRPNAMGLSVVEFDSISHQNGTLCLNVKGVDLLDCTPILDIKPYVPYADSIINAQGGYADSAPAHMAVEFGAEAMQHLMTLEKRYPQLETLIREVLSQDPRPAYQAKQTSTKEFGMSLYDLNIRWHVVAGTNQVLSISAIE
ncbi:MAG: tRNA-Thr(GGU) m(6)t(6)A37 methyltransferase TsaA [Paraglaciecola sp.]